MSRSLKSDSNVHFLATLGAPLAAGLLGDSRRERGAAGAGDTMGVRGAGDTRGVRGCDGDGDGTGDAAAEGEPRRALRTFAALATAAAEGVRAPLAVLSGLRSSRFLCGDVSSLRWRRPKLGFSCSRPIVSRYASPSKHSGLPPSSSHLLQRSEADSGVARQRHIDARCNASARAQHTTQDRTPQDSTTQHTNRTINA